jgi:hypothetical protein
MTDEAFLSVFRLVIPEFAGKADTEVLTQWNLIKPQISEKKLGSLYPQAAAYLTAHQFAWNALIAAGGSTGANVVGGNVTSEKEGDLQRSYADTGGTGKIDVLDRSAYGQEFKRLARRRIIPAITRMG